MADTRRQRRARAATGPRPAANHGTRVRSAGWCWRVTLANFARRDRRTWNGWPLLRLRLTAHAGKSSAAAVERQAQQHRSRAWLDRRNGRCSPATSAGRHCPSRHGNHRKHALSPAPASNTGARQSLPAGTTARSPTPASASAGGVDATISDPNETRACSNPSCRKDTRTRRTRELILIKTPRGGEPAWELGAGRSQLSSRIPAQEPRTVLDPAQGRCGSITLRSSCLMFGSSCGIEGTPAISSTASAMAGVVGGARHVAQSDRDGRTSVSGGTRSARHAFNSSL